MTKIDTIGAGPPTDAGANIRISPSWLPGAVTIVDISWNSAVVAFAPNPTGPWSGDLALLGGTGSLDGNWDWDRTQLKLELWVPLPGTNPPVGRLIAVLDDFDLPAFNGTTGTGALNPNLAPVSGVLDFDWEIAAVF